jgi:hypothetical protein
MFISVKAIGVMVVLSRKSGCYLFLPGMAAPALAGAMKDAPAAVTVGFGCFFFFCSRVLRF